MLMIDENTIIVFFVGLGIGSFCSCLICKCFC